MVFFILEVSWIVLHGVLYEAARRRWNATGYRELVQRAPRAARWLRMAYQLIIAAVWWWGLLLLESPHDDTSRVFLLVMQPQWSALYRSLRWHLGGKQAAARQAAQAAALAQRLDRAIADLAAVGVLVTQVAPARYDVRAPGRAIPSVTGLKTADELIATTALVRTVQVLHELFGMSYGAPSVVLGSPPSDPSRN